jgi:hypothetical protein
LQRKDNKKSKKPIDLIHPLWIKCANRGYYKKCVCVCLGGRGEVGERESERIIEGMSKEGKAIPAKDETDTLNPL